ncbi:hypothetical protein CDD81_5054 [Ophiocordyceps australis]|uniref:Thioredoxin domain-containing protein n=1 Tax=Ophiocordyceps australis TaxID=1399860 RepID=A0A2C5YB01_9HYPO|nr:hypothetical protein CDD81_5054 [Ophiocordyceps australis]
MPLAAMHHHALRQSRHAARLGLCPRLCPRLCFSASAPRSASNVVFDAIRSPESFMTHLSACHSPRIPLLTLWTTSYCIHSPGILRALTCLVQSGVGQPEGGVALASVEMDAPDIAANPTDPNNLALMYMINSLPTLLSFDAGEAQTDTRVTDTAKLADEAFLQQWIRTEARRHGQRGGGTPASFFGLFRK